MWPGQISCCGSPWNQGQWPLRYRYRHILEACSGWGEAKVLTRSFQMGAAHAGMKMGIPFQPCSLSGLPWGFSGPYPSGGIPHCDLWLGWMELFCFLEPGRRDCSFLLTLHFPCVKDLRWFQHVPVSVTSRLRWVPFLFVLGMVYFSSLLTLFLDCLNSWFLELFPLVLLVFSCPQPKSQAKAALQTRLSEPLAMFSTAHSYFSITNTGSWHWVLVWAVPSRGLEAKDLILVLSELFGGVLYNTWLFLHPVHLSGCCGIFLLGVGYSFMYPRFTLSLLCNWDAMASPSDPLACISHVLGW